ncbi:MAG: CDP-2,3-bis-(O-geranylgeranyl)-sn-glycerol synthase [Candidatus Syntropharchaeia archaeon]
MIEIALLSIWLMVPAYVPNPCAVLFGGGTPIDMGKHFLDGERILGDGKTFRGFVFGTICGILVGVIQTFFASSIGFPSFPLTALVSLSSGSLFGDLAKSFFKRRIGLERGAPLPIADQLDFVGGAWLFSFLFARDWFTEYFFDIRIVLCVLIITPFLHLGTNVIGYLMGKKDVYW